MAALLGSATGDGTTITVPVTLAVPGSGILVVAWALATPADDSGNGVSAVSDPSAVAWSLHHAGANVGAVRDQIFASVDIGSNTRNCTPGDLHAGDDVTLTLVSTAPGSLEWVAVLIFIPGVANTAVAWEDPLGSGGSVDYSNFDLISSDSADGHTLNEASDVGTHPYPLNDAVMIAVAGSYSAPFAWTPAVLTKVAEEIGANCSVAICIGNVAAGTTKEAGGSFAGNPNMGALGFQFALGSEPRGARIWKRF